MNRSSVIQIGKAAIGALALGVTTWGLIAVLTALIATPAGNLAKVNEFVVGQFGLLLLLFSVLWFFVIRKRIK